ncbi:hypothetical protein QBC46DRAFT_256118 [Diplogelasinospora grovesii]|uniref:tRNA-intron lyase n=1 Tax=Diplogelasinospora grovesii TaxID=303347 RepID=A0AAN6S7B6_9PEZI|nr:hypothetical protein QBC46DRAFT_256118 [Diplogelasinospora grovesii]
MSLSGEAAGEHKLPSNGSVVIQPAASAKPRANQSPSSRKSDTIPPYKMYALPAPIRTFPLPSFYPNNPLSLFHLVYAWLSQTFFPPPAEPSVVHEGTWDPDTRSVHIKDAKSIRALWQQGFFGKGSLSRSEPNWLKREISRRGDAERGVVAEQRTDARREERRMAKWERAKNELEAIERVKHEEAQSKETTAEELANGHVESPEPPSAQIDDVIEMDLPCPDLSLTEAPPLQSRSAIADDIPNGHLETRKPPVGPLELLALPNSLADLSSETKPSLPESQPPAVNGITNGSIEGPKPPVGPLELLALPNSLPFCPQPTAADDTTESPKTPVSPLEPLSLPTSLTDLTAGSSLTQEEPELSPTDHVLDGHANGVYGILNGTCSASTPLSSAQGSTKKPQTNGQVAQPLKRRKGVRFSPEVESTTFQHTDPPSPNRSPPTATLSQGTVAERSATEAKPSTAGDTLPSSLDISVVFGELVNKEHFQLSPEEAFFLVFSLGALKIVDPVTKATIPTEQLLALFRSHSYFPARTADGSLTAGLQPHDPFLVHFAVYHHFRSLGWVPRHGIKFGVDWLLYQRGPVFDHAEFGLMVVPSFSDARWSEYEHEKAKRSWSWLMGVNRVLSHVLKGLVLVYVDVPPPPVFDEAMASGGIADALRKYTIREVMVRRWSSNRNR